MGLDVLLIERNRIGVGTSQSNGGWITPSKATPLPAPGVLRRALRSLLRRDGSFAVDIGPLLTTGLLTWLLGFWSHCIGVVHGSTPNVSDHSRIGLAVRFISPEVKHSGDDRPWGMLVRGEDVYHHFDLVDRPAHGKERPDEFRRQFL